MEEVVFDIPNVISWLDGHTLYPVPEAKKMCKTLGVEPFKGDLEIRWRSEKEALKKHGLVYVATPKGSGIAGTTLAYYLADKLGLEYERYHGRGTQVRAIIDALRKHFNLPVVD
jgi:hypothetical protein